MHFGGFGGGGMHSVAAASLAVVSAEAWSPAGAYSSPGETALSAHPFAGQRFVGNRFNNFAFRRNAFFFRNRFFFRHHHFRNFVFVGAPFLAGNAAYGDYCWRQTWTRYGWQWVNVCYSYGYLQRSNSPRAALTARNGTGHIYLPDRPLVLGIRLEAFVSAWNAPIEIKAIVSSYRNRL